MKALLGFQQFKLSNQFDFVTHAHKKLFKNEYYKYLHISSYPYTIRHTQPNAG